MLWGIIASFIIGIGGWIAKIEININRIQRTIDTLRVKGSIVAGGTIKAGGPGSLITFGEGQEGNWRITQEGNSLKFQQMRMGKWITISIMDSQTTISKN